MSREFKLDDVKWKKTNLVLTLACIRGAFLSYGSNGADLDVGFWVKRDVTNWIKISSVSCKSLMTWRSNQIIGFSKLIGSVIWCCLSTGLLIVASFCKKKKKKKRRESCALRAGLVHRIHNRMPDHLNMISSCANLIRNIGLSCLR